jgi:hypothetical protein
MPFWLSSTKAQKAGQFLIKNRASPSKKKRKGSAGLSACVGLPWCGHTL